jgi:hypothetical protein
MRVGAVELEGISVLDVNEIVGRSTVSCVATCMPESSKGAGLIMGASGTCLELELVATGKRISPIDDPSSMCEVVWPKSGVGKEATSVTVGGATVARAGPTGS